jgi:hypothetical protein
MAVAAVITADIVNSTRLNKPDEKKLINALTHIFGEHKLEFYRGDSFQVYLKTPLEAYRLILQARTMAMKLLPSASNHVFDVRASIGIGAVDHPVRSLKTASGEAFILSGRAFDEMKPEQRLLIQCNEQELAINEGFRIIGHFTDYLFRHLTAKQAAVVSELLSGFTQIDIAKRLKKSQSTINKHTQAAGWTEMERLLAEYQNLVHLIKP